MQAVVRFFPFPDQMIVSIIESAIRMCFKTIPIFIEETQESFDEVYDEFGDSYGSRASMESLKYSMNEASLLGRAIQKLNPSDIADIEDQYGISGKICYILLGSSRCAGTS